MTVGSGDYAYTTYYKATNLVASPETPIVFITGYSEAKEKINNTNLSQHIMVKPIKENELIETVEIVLSERPVTVSV